MKKILFLETTFGKLFYHNVYSFYAEPIIFTAFNEYRQFFFCYSLGLDDENQYGLWLIMPISEEKKNKLEQKDIPIIKMMKGKDCPNIKLLKINIDTGEIIEEWIPTNNYPYLMPENDVFISENINWDETRMHTHKIRVAIQNLTNTKLNEVTLLASHLIKSIFSKNETKVDLFPQDAVVGSFVYRVKTKFEKNTINENIDNAYSDFINFNNVEHFQAMLDNNSLDLKQTWKLLSLVKQYNGTVQFIDENSTEYLLNINEVDASILLELLDKKLDFYLDSTMVPQANEISRVKKYIDILSSKHSVTKEELNVTTDRQVAYYKDASRLLGLIDQYNHLTPVGIRVSETDESREWLNILKNQFENSECGYLWMKDQDVISILDINPDSAIPFLIDNANGLSEDTAKRRASTLKSWVNEFKTIQ